jgi:hypothetical protein
MPKHHSHERLERFNVVLSLEDTAWLDRLAGEIQTGTSAKVSRSEIIRAADHFAGASPDGEQIHRKSAGDHARGSNYFAGPTRHALGVAKRPACLAGCVKAETSAVWPK